MSKRSGAWGLRSVILGHANERTTLANYTHSMRRTKDDSADKIVAPAGLSDVGNNLLRRT